MGRVGSGYAHFNTQPCQARVAPKQSPAGPETLSDDSVGGGTKRVPLAGSKKPRLPTPMMVLFVYSKLMVNYLSLKMVRLDPNMSS
jgi:hypothetical protein